MNRLKNRMRLNIRKEATGCRNAKGFHADGRETNQPLEGSMLGGIYFLLMAYALVLGGFISLIAWLCSKKIHGFRIIVLVWTVCACVAFAALYALQLTEFGIIR